MTKATYARIHEAEQKVTQYKEEYLRRFEWGCLCNYPGAFWLWSRDFSDIDAKRLKWWEEAIAQRAVEGLTGGPSKPRPYGIIAVPMDLAVQMTRTELDHDEEEAEEAEEAEETDP